MNIEIENEMKTEIQNESAFSPSRSKTLRLRKRRKIILGGKMAERVCPRCQQRPPRDGQGYCLQCARDYQREWKRLHPDAIQRHRATERAKRGLSPGPEPRGCLICGAIFTPLRSRNQRYCSKQCLDRAGDLKALYGLTPEQYQAILVAQDYRCAICHNRTETWHVDHDHTLGYGTVRALLCRRCNLGLGQFEDDPGRLRAAAAYLEKHHQKRQLRLVENA